MTGHLITFMLPRKQKKTKIHPTPSISRLDFVMFSFSDQATEVGGGRSTEILQVPQLNSKVRVEEETFTFDSNFDMKSKSLNS